MTRLSPVKRRAAARGGVVSLIAAVTAVTLVLGAVSTALRLPGFARLGGLGSRSLDYARGPAGGFFPLTDSFVREALGPVAGAPREAGLPTATGGVPPAAGREPAPVGNAGSDDGAVPPADEVAADLGNDDFASAYPIRGLPFTSRTTRVSTREPGEPDPCGPPGGTRWFRYTPRADVGLLATTAGTELGSAISVFTGSSMSDLTLIGCTGSPNGGNQVPFAAETGTTYWFQAKKTVGDGALVFSLHAQGTTSLASVSSDGRAAGADSGQPRVSADGRFVVFNSEADLVPGTQNGCLSAHHPDPSKAFVRNPGPCQNVYVRDLVRGTTVLVSTPDGEVAGDDDSWEPSISGNGRFVAFFSWASNLVAGDTNGMGDVFLRDLATSRTTRVSVTSAGQQTSGEDFIRFTAVSDDGRFVAFSSGSPELTGDLPGPFCTDVRCVPVFIRDVHMGRTQLVSVDADGDAYPQADVAGLTPDGSRVAYTTGTGANALVVVSDWQHRGRVTVASVPDGPPAEPNGRSDCPTSSCLSADGRYVTFNSDADNLVRGDTNGANDVFVRDLARRRTTRVSVSSTGTQSTPTAETASNLAATEASAGFPTASISADGRFIAFGSDAPDLVPGDSNGTYDVFLHDQVRRTTTRLSVHTDGTQSNGVSHRPSVSRGARTTAFIGRGFDGGDTGTFAVYVRQQPTF